jgi:hypothetical protein
MKQYGVPENPGNQGNLTTYALSVGYLRLHKLNEMTASFFVVLQPGLISQANGSAYIETERTKIACAVYVHCATAHQHTKRRSAGMVHVSRKTWGTVSGAA